MTISGGIRNDFIKMMIYEFILTEQVRITKYRREERLQAKGGAWVSPHVGTNFVLRSSFLSNSPEQFSRRLFFSYCDIIGI